MCTVCLQVLYLPEDLLGSKRPLSMAWDKASSVRTKNLRKSGQHTL